MENVKEQILKVSEYVFEIDNVGIEDVKIEYKFSNTKELDYRDNNIDYSVLDLTIKGLDYRNNEECFISLELNTNLEELNKYTTKPSNILDKVVRGESFIKRPNSKVREELYFEFLSNDISDMYRNISSIWISKKEENIFIIKISIPSEDIFTFFTIDFN